MCRGRNLRTLCRCLVVFLLLLTGVTSRATVYFVSPKGNDANAGTSWGAAKQTVQAAINLTFSGDQVWVAQGNYVLTTTINMTSGIRLYGGFNGTEVGLRQRDFVHNVTILDGNGQVTVVTCPANTGLNTRVDGFTIQNGAAAIGSGAGISCFGPMTIANDVVKACNNASANNSTGAGGIFISNVSAGQVNNCMLSGNTPTGITSIGSQNLLITATTVTGSATGMYLVGSAVTVSNNVATGNGYGIDVRGSGLNIIGNTITYNSPYGGLDVAPEGHVNLVSNNDILFNTSNSYAGGADIQFQDGSDVQFTNNVVAGNYAPYGGGGAYISQGNVVIQDNLFVGNSTGGSGGAIVLNQSYGLDTVVNNTIADNSAGSVSQGGGIYISQTSANAPVTDLSNNIVAFNSSGIDVSSGPPGTVTLNTNDVYGNTWDDYSGIGPGATDRSVDPLFVDHAHQDYHLATLSLCIDVGTDSFVSFADTDLDGNPRIFGAHVDLGCYEWIPDSYPDLAFIAVPSIVICSGQSAEGLVALTSAAIGNGATVELTSSNPTLVSVPSSVTVPTGSTESFFVFTVAPSVTSYQTVTILASYRGITQSATVTVAPLMAGLTLSPSAVVGGGSVTGTVTLNCPAPTDLTVTLASSDASVTVPATATISAGTMSGTFTAKTAAASAVKTVTLSATYGSQTVSAPLVIDPAATLQNLTAAPGAITGGLSVIGVVTLTGATPAGGVVVPLTSSVPTAASVPSTVTIPAGKRSVSFVVNTSVVSAKSVVTLTAVLGAVTKTFKLTVAPATIASLTLVPSSVQGGESSFGIVTLTAPAPSAVTVTLTGSSVATPDVVDIIIPTGAIQGTFSISTAAVTKQTTATIQATAYKLTKKAILTVTP